MKKVKKKFQPVKESEGINIEQLKISIYEHKFWFIVLSLTGLLLAFFFNHFSHQKYTVNTTLVLKDDNAEGTLSALYKQLGVQNKNGNVQNQIGVLSSFTLNLQALQNLNWQFSWSQDKFLSHPDLYKNDPYRVGIPSGSLQILGVPLHIKQISEKQYTVEADETREINGIKREIDFKQTGTFGKPFKNKFFSFRLNKIPNQLTENGDQYILVFNDLVLMAKDYQKNLKITAGDAESDLITMSLEATQLNRSIDFLNELDKVYIDYGLAEKTRLANNTVDFINKQLAGVSDSLKTADEKVTDYRSDNNVVDISQQSSAIINRLDKINNDESAAKIKVDYFKSLKRYINNAAAMKSLVSPSVVGVTDPALNSLVIKLGDLFQQREVLSNTAQEGSPQLISLNKEISYTQKSLSENINNLLENAQMELNNLSNQRASISAQLSSLPQKQQNLKNISRKSDLNNDLYTFLLQKKSEAQIAQASRDPDAKVLDAASFGTADKTGLKKFMVLFIGLFAGLALPLIYLILKTFFHKKLNYVSDISGQLSISVIGNILYNKFDTELPVLAYPNSDVTESFRGLRINIQYLLKNKPSKVIALHSSIAGEGKTFVSANLASILALTNKTVLLIDADLRKARTHKIYNLSNKVGLSDYLEGTTSFTEVIQPTKTKGLSVVCAGSKPLFPSELLNNSKLEEMINEAKKYYEYIIINNPPVNIVNDAMMVVPFADMNLFLLRIKSSTKNELMFINKIAQEGIIKNMAVALNNVTYKSIGLYEKNNGGYYNDNRYLPVG